MNAIYSGLNKTKCTFSANVAFDTAKYERTNCCKTTDMSITYLDATSAESGLEPETARQTDVWLSILCASLYLVLIVK